MSELELEVLDRLTVESELLQLVVSGRSNQGKERRLERSERQHFAFERSDLLHLAKLNFIDLALRAGDKDSLAVRDKSAGVIGSDRQLHRLPQQSALQIAEVQVQFA